MSEHQIQPEYRMSRLTRDGIAEPISRDQILRREQGQKNINFLCSADHTSRIGNLTRLILTLAICDGHKYNKNELIRRGSSCI